MSDCSRDICYCCNRGHVCEPPRYPDDLRETWDCPDCDLRYRAFDIHSEQPDNPATKYVPHGALGWTTKAADKR